jgi:hypothetical protein
MAMRAGLRAICNSLIAAVGHTSCTCGAAAICGACLTFALARDARAATYRNPKDQLALELAVVAAHEGALDNARDTALVWQVVEARALTTQARLMFLRAQPDEPPASLSSAWWNATRAPAWMEVRRYASELVYGIELWRPCPVAPYSWGYAGDLESAWLERRLVPVGCEGTMNEGFTVAPRALTAAFISRSR